MAYRLDQGIGGWFTGGLSVTSTREVFVARRTDQ